MFTQRASKMPSSYLYDQ
ncbi:hypothetical protein [Escherichia fergusonii]|nr:hypothetical protein [Escherichia fergusonii]